MRGIRRKWVLTGFRSARWKNDSNGNGFSYAQSVCVLTGLCITCRVKVAASSVYLDAYISHNVRREHFFFIQWLVHLSGSLFAQNVLDEKHLVFYISAHIAIILRYDSPLNSGAA